MVRLKMAKPAFYGLASAFLTILRTSPICGQTLKRTFLGTPAPLTFGNVGRKILAGPHLFNIDSSPIRKFQIKERLNVEFNASTLNVTNTPWFDRPDTIVQDVAFGQVTTAQGNQSVKVNMNRSIQFSMRVSF